MGECKPGLQSQLTSFMAFKLGFSLGLSYKHIYLLLCKRCAGRRFWFIFKVHCIGHPSMIRSISVEADTFLLKCACKSLRLDNVFCDVELGV